MSREFELSRRKILGAVGGVGIASAGAGMGTSAFFSDTESFEGNSMTAGELDLRIDWQQQYYGPTESWEFVNAHPDHDDDGEQSLEIDGTTYTYSGNGGANLQEQITCQTLTNNYDFEGNPDYTVDNQESLILLDDVKPGDMGEITFSTHLCDNPAYLWLQGELVSNLENNFTEPEPEDDNEKGELLDAIEVRAWYDLDCDNQYDAGESVIFENGSLGDFLTDLSTDNGRRLSPLPYEGFTMDQDGETEELCLELGKIEWDDTEKKFIVADDDDSELADSGSYDQLFKLISDDQNAVEVEIGVDVDEFDDDGDPLEVNFFLDDPQNDPGICRADVFGGNVETIYTFDGVCVTGSNDNLEVQEENMGGNQPAISNITFYYCPPDIPSTDIPLCFEGETTYCIGFQWWLPTDVGNEIQTDSVEFDLGFYAEQCRHNDSPGQTMN